MADAMAIAMVQVDSWRTTYAGIVPQEYLDALSYEQRATVWRTILSATAQIQFVYVAECDGGSVVGFASGGQVRNSDPVFESELYTIYLLESHQHMGLGRLLTSKIPQRLLEEGIHSMLVWVLAANPSRLFYEALGATQVSERDITIGNARCRRSLMVGPILALCSFSAANDIGQP